MNDVPFLIAHKVRNEPAFDIAIQMDCPECLKYRNFTGENNEPICLGCDECEGQGFWWICSTSGHRAYPFWSRPVEDLVGIDNGMIYSEGMIDTPMPELGSVPDHYPINASPHTKVADIGKSILAKLGLGRSATPIKRRI